MIAADLRSAGDLSLVLLSEDGVQPADITLADELWLLSLRADNELRDLRADADRLADAAREVCMEPAGAIGARRRLIDALAAHDAARTKEGL